MDEQTKGFRSAVFGGFRREDVLRYIEETDAKYYEESERLRSSLDDAQTAMGELRRQNEKAHGEKMRSCWSVWAR